jgi:hypothetical protein
MNQRVTELHCIMPEAKRPLGHGARHPLPIRAVKVSHRSVALKSRSPEASGFTSTQNLYFHARNPMMFKRRGEALCVLRVSTDVLQINGTVITDQNAASDYVRFLHASPRI